MSSPEGRGVERESLRGIGAMSRASGLTISALRFYDSAGVLRPARVDPDTGYRSYAPDQLAVAKLVAVLRRVGMPVAGIREVLAHRGDPAHVETLLDAHVRSLEQRLADARRALSSVTSLLSPEEPAMSGTTFVVPAAALSRALRAVRFAVGADPELPVLSGVLLEVDGTTLTLVATDRYRLALAEVTLAAPAEPTSVVVPAHVLDEIATGSGEVAITVDGESLTSGNVAGALLPDAFPDYRPLVPQARDGILVDVTALRNAPAHHVRDGIDVLALDEQGRPAASGVGVNREFLLEAVDAVGPGQLQLELDGPLAPLVIRSPSSLSLLMPIRLDA
ncbi:MerR family transcriptional regulator [Actinomycetes bacterium KLBMP 9759]